MASAVDGCVGQSLRARVEVLFVEHVDAVFNVAHRVLWNRADAEDVVQATFVKAFERLGQLRDPKRVRPWLLQVAYREALTSLRQRRAVPMDPGHLPDEPTKDDGPADRAVLSDVISEISHAFSQLGSDERMAVVLRDVEQLSMREVAEVLDISPSAAKMRVHRGRQSLRHLLSKRGVTP